MTLSWTEIRSNALAFSREWAKDISEDAEAKSFWDAFFQIFGVSRRRIASFEEPVKKSDGSGGFIDLLWKGVLIVEHKSRGKDLKRAFHQATDYFYGLKDRDLPKYVLVSDFARLRLYDLDQGTETEFPLAELHKHIGLFGFIAGYKSQTTPALEEAASIKAAEQLGRLHDQLKASGYQGHQLEVLLVRLLFCLFADDTGIFERRNQFKDYLETRTAEDGIDLGQHLSLLFQVLNTPAEKRQKSLDELLAGFTYVNGRLFEETLPIPAFDRTMRETLLEAAGLDWSRISPAIFGSLFQSIMDKEARRNLGAHYTRESNILKALRPLFLHQLAAELTACGNNAKKLTEFQKKLANIRILDPACGCGNFLVIAYRELRRLEVEVLRRLLKAGESSRALDIAGLVRVDVDQFYGIEIEEFPAQIAQVALWLTDHQMNQVVSEEFGAYFVRLPLKKAPNIVHGNALRIDWQDVVPAAQLSYIVGNPPFRGKQLQSQSQKQDLRDVCRGIQSAGVLDYVAGWYVKAALYMRAGSQVRTALVSTNSITQGEQVGILWSYLIRFGVYINFAHRTFRWSSEARGGAAVHCVVIGFALTNDPDKAIFEYEEVDSEPTEMRVTRISPYLVEAENVLLSSRRSPICNVPPIIFGNMANDDGNLLLDDEERAELLRVEPQAARWIKPFIQVDELLYGTTRWCLWLKDAGPQELRQMPHVLARVERVRAVRSESARAETRALAGTPACFGEIRQPESAYLVVPRHTGEDRRYIPIAKFGPETICGDANLLIPVDSLYILGVVESLMHMAWVRAVCGRLESRYRYSAGIVYNNFPWPEPTSAQREAITSAAQGVLDARAAHPGATLADLYDPLTMPPDLLKAHHKLDRVVDAAYGRKDFKTEAERVAFLFERYQQLTAPLAAAASRPKARRRRAST
jgi:hypothetical protein